MQKSRAIGYGVIAILLIATLVFTKPILLTNLEFRLPFDRVWYYKMALGRPGVAEPFLWRVGLPWGAKVLPFGVETNFRILCFGFLTLAAVSLFELLRVRLKEPLLPVLGVLLLFGNFLVGRGLDDFWITDVPTFGLVLAIGWCYAREWWVAVLLLSCAGGAIREMIPLLSAALCFAITPSWRACLPLAGMASYVALRIAMPDSYQPKFAEVLAYRKANFGLRTFAFEYLMRPVSMGLALLVAWMVLRQGRLRTAWWKLVPTLLLVGLQLVSGTDNARLVVGIFFPLLVVALFALDASEISRRNMGLLLGLAALGAVCSIGRVPPAIYIGGHGLWVLIFALANWKRPRPEPIAA